MLFGYRPLAVLYQYILPVPGMIYKVSHAACKDGRSISYEYKIRTDHRPQLAKMVVLSSTSAKYVLITDSIATVSAVINSAADTAAAVISSSLRAHACCYYSNTKRNAQAALFGTQLR